MKNVQCERNTDGGKYRECGTAYFFGSCGIPGLEGKADKCIRTFGSSSGRRRFAGGRAEKQHMGYFTGDLCRGDGFNTGLGDARKYWRRRWYAAYG